MLIWCFLRATRYYFLLTNHSIHTIKGTEQNLIKILSTGSLKTLKPLILLGFQTLYDLFPLNRADRLGGEIHYDAVDTFDLMGDAVGDMM